MPTPPCRVCGKTAEVICYREEQPELTICPDCCDKADHPDGEHSHQWVYDEWEGWICTYCGIHRGCTEYEDSFIDRG